MPQGSSPAFDMVFWQEEHVVLRNDEGRELSSLGFLTAAASARVTGQSANRRSPAPYKRQEQGEGLRANTMVSQWLGRVGIRLFFVSTKI
jgi:hypothetical protein